MNARTIFRQEGLRFLRIIGLALVLATSAVTPAEAGKKYSDYDRRDRDRLRTANCESIRDRDLRNYCKENCEFINDRDLRTLCKARPLDKDVDRDGDDEDDEE